MNGDTFEDFMLSQTPGAELVRRDSIGVTTVFKVGQMVISGESLYDGRVGVIDSFRDTGIYVKFNDAVEPEPILPTDIRVIDKEIYAKIQTGIETAVISLAQRPPKHTGSASRS
jgi:hypothetical protein